MSRRYLRAAIAATLLATTQFHCVDSIEPEIQIVDEGDRQASSPGTPYLWDASCLSEPAAMAIQLGEIGNPGFTMYTRSDGTIGYPANGKVGMFVNSGDYNKQCKDGYLLDVYGTQQIFGIVVDYYQALPTNKTDCENTSIWVSGHEYGRYVGAYLDYMNGATEWNRFDEHGEEKANADQTPKSGSKRQLATRSYGKWANGTCTLRGLSLQLRHPGFPFGDHFPWYRLVVGGFRGVNGTGETVDKSRLRVQVGHFPAVPGCTADQFCNRHGADSPFTDTYVTTTCANGDSATRLIAVHACTAPPPTMSDEAAVVAIGLFLAMVIAL